ncbi:MAG: hypothetical protein A3I61_14900 [Acidobacteria bacterium RIFCSPLOWO2_02_FULL_68_18]|nr:MAG: hypothetical protein A3I61_14900 [Acidobacteria bacterium RIFCSPLOWO2_02_FULL_68_18]OFW50378.1 MAG: hypothetical protein A3G77_07925 [Acidobacteria bacterium RIFCSPLOWO2_12_FULL_68_19]
MIVVSNRVPVVKGKEAEFAARFSKRAGLVDRHPGFVRLDILRPEPITLRGQQMGGSDYHVVLTYWERKEDFIAWTESEDFRTAHSQQTPREIFAGPSVFEMHEVIQSAGKPVGGP